MVGTPDIADTSEAGFFITGSPVLYVFATELRIAHPEQHTDLPHPSDLTAFSHSKTSPRRASMIEGDLFLFRVQAL